MLHSMHEELLLRTKMTSPNKMFSNKHGLILSIVFFFVFFVCALASIDVIRFDSVLEFGRRAIVTSQLSGQASNSSLDNHTPTVTATSPTTALDENATRILIGVLTLPDLYPRRNFLRQIYGVQKPPGAQIDLKFIFCNLTKEDQKVLVALEIMQFNDIIILNCTENMNKGKTYSYFSSLPDLLLNNTDYPHYPPYDYVMKADDDIFIRLETLVRSLKPLPKQDLYYGFVIPCTSFDPFKDYMSGMGYLVSWDIVEWIPKSEIPKMNLEGPEDMMFGQWMMKGHKGKNRFNAKWSMYDYPEPKTICTHELWPETIAVHRLKDQEKWIRTLNYFNFTRDLKPSKFYHIPPEKLN